MPHLGRIYLDNAATSWPKPEAVYQAVELYQRKIGAPAGRGAYRDAIEAGRIVDSARSAIARLIGADQPSRIVFTANGTDSLNLALHGLLKPGDHIVTTVVEHNSMLRPLHELEARGQVTVSRVGLDSRGLVDPGDIRAAMQPETKLVALCHASNVTGAIEPAAEIGQVAHGHGAVFLLDAAQSLGHVPISVGQLEVDLLAAPGHKGLMGPLGTGVLYIRSGMENQLDSIRQGGTGTHSAEDRQPNDLPDKYESGNLNVLGLAGLAAAVNYLEREGVTAVQSREMALTGRLLAGLTGIEGVVVHGPADLAKRVGVVSVTLAGLDPHEAAALLDGAFGVQVRSGLHCAPLMHRALGTQEGGTIRFSLGAFNTESDVDQAVAAVGEIISSAVATK